MNLNSSEWQHIFNLAKQICRENKLKECHYKFLHRIIVTKKELCRFGIKQDSDCLYCGNEDYIEHTFINCQFLKAFQRRVIQWFNNVNYTNQHPSVKETLFGLFPTSSIADKTLLRNSIIPCCICAIAYTPANSTIDQLLSLILSIN